jgi:hypothetical protein
MLLLLDWPETLKELETSEKGQNFKQKLVEERWLLYLVSSFRIKELRGAKILFHLKNEYICAYICIYAHIYVYMHVKLKTSQGLERFLTLSYGPSFIESKTGSLCNNHHLLFHGYM